MNRFDELSKRKNYVTRFRIDYYAFVFGTSSAKDFLRKFMLNIIGFASLIRYVLIYQMGKSKKLDSYSKYIIHLSDSNSFLKTILPVCDMLLENGAKPLFLCPGNHYDRLVKRLDPKIVASLFRYEQIQMYPNKVMVIINMTRALILSAFDVIWFIFQPVKQSFATSLSFRKHSFVHHYSDRFWKSFFEADKKIFLAAEDQYLWEAALFWNIKGTPSLSFVFQHGKLSEVYYPTLAKYFCVLGVIDYKKMVDEFNASPAEICEVGSPCFDLIYNHYQKNPVRKGNEQKYIVFFAQPWYRVSAVSVTYYRTVLNWFYKLSENRQLNQYKFILKLHPHDLTYFYSSRPSQIEIAHNNLLELIEKSIFTITVDSSSIFESAFCGVPAIQTIVQGHDLFADESSTGISVRTSSYEELETLALRLIEDKAFYNQTLTDSGKALHLYFSNLGHSLDIIKELLLV